ncbi:hypothetical protein EI94DRAFT_1699439 [Lactarius quietus]|nr:hypothetical protein EI94DRAFT_1699439 [Lactarius quietus]
MNNFKMTVKGPKIEDVPELKLLAIGMAAVKNKNMDDGWASLVQGTAVVGQKEKEIKKMEKAVKNMEKVSMNEKGEGEWKKAMKVIAKERKKLETAKMWVVPVTEHGPSQDGESKQEVGEEENSMIILDKFNENWQVKVEVLKDNNDLLYLCIKQLLAHSLVMVSWIWHHYMHAEDTGIVTECDQEGAQGLHQQQHDTGGLNTKMVKMKNIFCLGQCQRGRSHCHHCRTQCLVGWGLIINSEPNLKWLEHIMLTKG